MFKIIWLTILNLFALNVFSQKLIKVDISKVGINDRDCPFICGADPIPMVITKVFKFENSNKYLINGKVKYNYTQKSCCVVDFYLVKNKSDTLFTLEGGKYIPHCGLVPSMKNKFLTKDLWDGYFSFIIETNDIIIARTEYCRDKFIYISR